MKNRRNLLKVLSVAGATGAIETWHKPVVDSVVLPSHATTSCAGGCYATLVDSFSAFWDQESGTVSFYDNPTCSGSPYFSSPAVVADSAVEADPSLPCSINDDIESLNQNTEFDGPCFVWFCD